MNDIYELRINDEMIEIILAVWKQFSEQLHFFSLKKIQGYKMQLLTELLSQCEDHFNLFILSSVCDKLFIRVHCSLIDHAQQNGADYEL